MRGEAGEEDAQSLVQLKVAVILSEDGSQGAQVWEVFCRQPVESEAEDGFVFVRVHNVFLQFVPNVPVEESLVRPVDVEGVGGGKTGVYEQCQDLFEGPDGAQWVQTQRCGQWPGDQQRDDVGMPQGQKPQVVGDLRSCACQSGSSAKIANSLRTVSATPSCRAVRLAA